MSKSKIVQRTMRVRMIALHRIKGDTFDVTFIKRQKIKPRRRQNTEFPLMSDSAIVPGLIFHNVRMVILYEDHQKTPSKKIWQILRCLESYGGKVTEEEILTNAGMVMW